MSIAEPGLCSVAQLVQAAKRGLQHKETRKRKYDQLCMCKGEKQEAQRAHVLGLSFQQPHLVPITTASEW